MTKKTPSGPKARRTAAGGNSSKRASGQATTAGKGHKQPDWMPAGEAPRPSRAAKSATAHSRPPQVPAPKGLPGWMPELESPPAARGPKGRKLPPAKQHVDAPVKAPRKGKAAGGFVDPQAGREAERYENPIASREVSG